MMSDWPKSVQTHTDGGYHHGWTQNDENSPRIPWIRLTAEAHADTFWFLAKPEVIFDRWGLERLDAKRYQELQHFMDGWWVDGIHYIYYAVGDKPESFKQIINWLLGPIAEVLNEWEIESDNMWEIIHPSLLGQMYALSLTDGFIKSKSKDAVRDLMHGFDLDYIAQDENYWAKDDGELDSLIATVYEREREKVLAGNPDKIGNWLVGQVMKESRGKADPASVRSKVQAIVEDAFNGT